MQQGRLDLLLRSSGIAVEQQLRDALEMLVSRPAKRIVDPLMHACDHAYEFGVTRIDV
jgi:hypothetical protein